MAWITNTVEDDKQVLEEMFWPTEKEMKKNLIKNAAAKKWLKDSRVAEKLTREKKGLKPNLSSAFNSELSPSVNYNSIFMMNSSI